MDELAAVKLVEKRSRFFAHLYSIEDQGDISEIVRMHRSRYRKARHHCYGARFLNDGNTEELFKNDGEVGHPGQVLLDILKRENMGSHCLMVSRIFGGTKLGVGGVSRAFREAGESVIDHFKKLK